MRGPLFALITLFLNTHRCRSDSFQNTETIPLKPAERLPGTDDNGDPSSVLLSMWNRGKRSVGLGLTNREIAELRYQGLYQVVDLTKNFFFSYSYDLTRSLQENFLSTTTKPFPPPPFEDMYAWNFFLTREFECCLEPSTRYFWIMPIIHGAYAQRKVNDYGRYLNITLIARRSRHFAGTRYLKRGVNEQGQVANDVEHEQVIHDESLTPGSFSSYLQVRGPFIIPLQQACKSISSNCSFNCLTRFNSNILDPGKQCNHAETSNRAKQS